MPVVAAGALLEVDGRCGVLTGDATDGRLAVGLHVAELGYHNVDAVVSPVTAGELLQAIAYCFWRPLRAGMLRSKQLIACNIHYCCLPLGTDFDHIHCAGGVTATSLVIDMQQQF